MDRRVTPPKRVTSPIWGTPPPCNQTFSAVFANSEVKFKPQGTFQGFVQSLSLATGG